MLLYNIDALMGALGVQHIPLEWRRFIDSSKSSIKAVLLYNGNLLPSIPIAYYENLRESHETIVILLEHIKYDTYNWRSVVTFQSIAASYVSGIVSQAVLLLKLGLIKNFVKAMLNTTKKVKVSSTSSRNSPILVMRR